MCVDLSVNIYAHDLYKVMNKLDIHYINTACEEYEDDNVAESYPKDTSKMYNTTIGHLHDLVEKMDAWKRKDGPTSFYEFGMNPGLIGHCTKKGLEDAASYFLTR